MNQTERRMLDLVRKGREHFHVNALKAEFEAEGTRTEEFLRLLEIARRAGVKIGLKIGGCEAKSDMRFLMMQGIDAILDAGEKLTEVTVGRSDLTASHRGPDVDCGETIAMVKRVARAARDRGLPTTMGGSVNAKTIAVLHNDGELRELVSQVETRKCVMKTDAFLQPGALEQAFSVEKTLLEMQLAYYNDLCEAAADRVRKLSVRL